MRVIVEGIEKPEQLSIVRAMGAHDVHGFLLGRPLADPADAELCVAAGDRTL